MIVKYNLFAGQNLDRLSALSDGLFPFAMTLLVLNLHVPVSSVVQGESNLRAALIAQLPRLIPYAMTFMTLGIFWVGQQTQLNLLSRTDRNLTWIHIAFLMTISLAPFSTALLAEYLTYRTALVVYWLNILLMGLMLYAGWAYARRAALIKEGTPPEVEAAVERRIRIAQTLYAFGALLCIFNTYWSIAFIVLVQLNYVLAPRIRFLYRL
jgi:uncharacterized membrane protein